MSMQQIIEIVRGFEGVLILQPQPGDGTPDVAWGDAFFYYSPGGGTPEHTQPYATIVTKDYPDDAASDLGAPDRWRVNIHVDRATFRESTGEDPRRLTSVHDFAAADVINPHPVYGALGWICVVVPAERTMEQVVALLRQAHDAARSRATRRAEVGGPT
ncbi:DUF6194 family protein [Agromyces sp. NPDC056523]|uniref:DUF6194 family protein n=1 Tax=Agromyces sp. NPDC056523 TaxID=3345850 RepID=UPI00366FDB69